MTTEPIVTDEPTQYELSLIDMAKRATIDIDGQVFELAVPDDYSVPQIKMMNRLWRDCQMLDMQDTMTEKDAKRYEENLNLLIPKAAPSLTPEILNNPNFRRTAKSAIIVAFFTEAATSHPLLKKTDLVKQLLASLDFTAEESSNTD